MKDAYYFSHDSNARNDHKILELRVKYGMEGYGIYWGIVEMLREAKAYQLPTKYETIAFGLGTDLAKVKDIIEGFGLFILKNEMFWSESLKTRMKKYENISKIRSEAGRIGGLSKSQAIAKASLKQTSSIKVNEMKVNESKEKIKTETKTDPPLFKPLALKTNGPTPEQLMALWNEKAHPNLPRAEMMTDKRKSHIGARLKDHPEKEFWEKLIERVNNSPLLRGDNDRSWKCNFDWILNVNNMAKILEGNYDPVKRYS